MNMSRKFGSILVVTLMLASGCNPDGDGAPAARPTTQEERDAVYAPARADCRLAAETDDVERFVREMELEVDSLQSEEVAEAYGTSPHWPDDMSERGRSLVEAGCLAGFRDAD